MCGAVASLCVSLCMFGACKSWLRSLWRILLNYTAADKATLTICSLKKLKKKKKDGLEREGEGVWSRVDFEEQLEDSYNPLGRFGCTKRGRIEADLERRSSSLPSAVFFFFLLSALKDALSA